MSFGLLSIGTQSLQANRSALSVTGQNISNLNTEGYTRQRPVFLSREDLGGVVVNDVDRVADEFLNRQIWADKSSYNDYDAYRDFADRMDNLLASNVTSVSKAMDGYFDSLQAVVDDPVNMPSRALFISQTESLVKRFNDLDANMRKQNDTINSRLETNVAEINSLAKSIAKLNLDIRTAKAANRESSELLDQRNHKLEELSKHIGFTSIEQQSGEISVFIGNGEPLVVGLNSGKLSAMPGLADSSQIHIGLQLGVNKPEDITDQISGGKIGGLLKYREEVLGRSLDELGRIALVFADNMNEQHQKGMDIDGNQGKRLFRDINYSDARSNRVMSSKDNLTRVQSYVDIKDVNAIKASEYRLEFNSKNTFTIERKSDEHRWTNNALTEVASAEDVKEDGQYYINPASDRLTLQIDGFQLKMDGASIFAGGNSYLIRPVRNAGSEISSAIGSGRELALASPLMAKTNKANAGSGEVSVNVTNKDYFNKLNDTESLKPPLSIKFSPQTLTTERVGTGTGNITANVADGVRLAKAGINFPLTLTHNAGNYTLADTSGTVLVNNGSLADIQTNYGIELTASGALQNGESHKISVGTLEKTAFTTATGSIKGTSDITASMTDVSQLNAVNFPVEVTYTAGIPNGTYRVVDQQNTELLAAGTANADGKVVVAGYGFSLDINTVPQDGETYQINKTSADKKYLITDNTGKQIVGDYISGQSISVPGSYEITMKNNPKIGDKFEVVFNTNGVSDNRNALAMADLQSKKMVDNATYQGKYGEMVERVGTQTAVAQLNAKAGKTVLEANIKLRSSVAGVSLDEEAAKLVQYQQAYQATAQLIRTSQTIFDSLLQSI